MVQVANSSSIGSRLDLPVELGANRVVGIGLHRLQPFQVTDQEFDALNKALRVGSVIREPTVIAVNDFTNEVQLVAQDREPGVHILRELVRARVNVVKVRTD